MTELETSTSLEALLAAAKRARAAFDWETTVSSTRQALAREGIPPGTAYALLDLQAEAHKRLGALGAEEADLAAMACLAKQMGDLERDEQVLVRQVDLTLRQGSLAESRRLARAALDAARKRGDRSLEAAALIALSRASVEESSSLAEGRDLAEEALALYRSVGDPVGEATALLWLSAARSRQVQVSGAAAQAKAALALFRREGDREGEGRSLNLLGIVSPDFAQRRSYYEQALSAYETLGDRRGQAQVHNNLALTNQQMGLYALSCQDATEAVEVVRRMGARLDLAYYLDTLARAWLGRGDAGRAETLFREGLALSREVGDATVEAAFLLGLGRAAQATGRLLEAAELYRKAADIFERLEIPTEQATSLAWLGTTSLALGDLDAARGQTTQAASLFGRAVGATSEYPPQETWWCRYQVLAASLPSEEQTDELDAAWLALDRAREEVLAVIANLSDAGLRRNYLNKVVVNRQIVQEWLRQAAQRGMPLVPLTGALPGPGGGQDQLRRMIDISLRLNARREAGDLARFVVDQVVELTGAEGAILYRVDEVGQRSVAAEFAVGPAHPSADVASLLDVVLLRRQAVLRHVPPDSPELEQLSQLCAPLVAAGRLLGLLYADMAGTFGRFTDRDRDLLSVLANQAAVALENAAWAESLERRVDERTGELRAANQGLEQRTAELAIINSVQQGLAVQLDMVAIYDLVGDKIRDVFDAQVVTITTYDLAARMQLRRYCVKKGQRFRTEAPHPLTLLSEHLIGTRQPLLINHDAARRCNELGMPPPIPGTEEPRSLLFVPLLGGNQVTGCLSLQNVEREHAFSESDVRLLTTLANSMSVALENARLFDESNRLLAESRQRAAELTTVNRISQAAASELDLEVLIQTVGEQVRATFDADIAYVALLDREAGLIRFPYAYGEDAQPMPLGKGLTSRIIQTGQPVHINRDYSKRSAELGVLPVGRLPESYLGVPIPVGGRAIGVISVQSTREQGRFDEDDLRLLSTIAANVGGALHNARLYHETERRAFQMATIAEVGREVSATLDVDGVLARIAGGVHSLFQARDTVLRLLQDDGRTFRTIVALGRYAAQFKLDVVAFGEGIAGYIAQSGVAEVIDDPMKDPRGVHVPGTLEVEESPEILMCAPLLSRGQTIGLLSVYRDRTQGLFTPVDLDFLVALVREAATAIENARLFEAEQRRAEQFQVISEVGRRMISLLPVDELLREIARLIKETLDYYLVGIALIEGEELLFKAGAGAVWESPEFQPPRVEVGRQGITGWVARSGEPLLVNDLSQESRYYSIPEAGEMQSELAVPLKTKERVIGVLHVQSDRLYAFDHSDLAVLQALAHQAAIAIENARLFAEAQRQQRFSVSLVENTPVAIVAVGGEDNRVTSWNPAAERLFGYTQAEALGRDLAELITSAETLDEFRQFTNSTLVDGRVHAVTQRRRKDGSPVDVELLAVSVGDGDGEMSLVAIYHDITELKQATRAIEESERRLADIIDFLPDATLVIDREGKVIAWNRAMEEMTGVRAGDILNKGDYEYALPFYGARRPILIDLVLLPDEELESRYAAIERQGATLVGEALVPVLRGKPAYLYATASALRGARGEALGAIETIRDISDRKQVEEELREAKAAAEAAAQAKSAFLATMSHEIRTPMNAVIGMTSLLLDTALSPEQREFAETIRSSGDALLTVINDILDFSKIEAGRIELECQPFDVRECVESALGLVAGQAAARGLELGCWIEPRVPAGIAGDEARLRQIVLNLLSNALKFTERGEVVVNLTVDEALQELREEGAACLHFTVRDTGLGIPPDRMDRLFQSFSQVDSSTTRKYGGTGLGLAISQRLAELMGGRIWAESAGIPGQGSTFHFVMHAHPAPIVPRVELQPAEANLRGRIVLIVDDNATSRRILALQVEAWGLVPRATGSPAEALEWLRSGQPFDLAILDRQMPEMDGVMLAGEMRRLRDERALPLIMVSSLGKGEAEEQGQFAALLVKPIRPSQLYSALVGLLVGREAEAARPAVPASPFDAEMGKRQPLRILLAEDNVVNQKLALRLLERLGYRADLAANGVEAIRAVERQPYDVVFMDVQMPEMDGLEATRQICARWGEGERPRIVAMTANALAEDREVCLAAGMDDYLAKPIRVEELVAALGRSRPRSRAGSG